MRDAATTNEATARPMAFVDIDGVLADVRHRLHFIERRPRDWDGFFDAAEDDPAHPEGLALVETLAHEHDIVFLTGRPRRLEADTVRWLAAHGIVGHPVVMRPERDRRPAATVKLELLRRLAQGRRVAVIVDDDAEVIRTMAAAGYPTFRATWEARRDDDALSVAQDELGRT